MQNLSSITLPVKELNKVDTNLPPYPSSHTTCTIGSKVKYPGQDMVAIEIIFSTTDTMRT